MLAAALENSAGSEGNTIANVWNLSRYKKKKHNINIGN